MSDHLFDDAIVDLLIDSSNPDMLNIAVDRKLDSIFDLHDAMKVQTRGNRVVSIGKRSADLRCDRYRLVHLPAGDLRLPQAKQAQW